MTRHDIDGRCPDRFAPVRDAFVQNFTQRDEVGAAVAVTIDDELVIDLWGGSADAAGTRPWQHDTLVNVYSCTKAATSIAAHLLVDRGELDLDAPVAAYWPDFAAEGKETVLVRWLLCHRAGLMGPRRPLRASDLYDWDTVCEALAASEPWLEPGTDAAYHSISFGFLVGELIRRISNDTVGGFLSEQISQPLGLAREVHLGCSPEELPRCADVIGAFGGPEGDDDARARERDLYIGMHPSFEAYTMIPVPHDQNSNVWRAAELPAVNGHMTARGLAGLYTPLANGGTANGCRLFSPSAIERMRQPQGPPGDLLLGPWVPGKFQWLAGFMNNLGGAGPNHRAFGHGGFGGSFGFADPEHRLAYGYVMNNLSPLSTSGNDPRSLALTDALYHCVG